jgi:DUF1365 family protein
MTTTKPASNFRSCLYECSVMHHRLTPQVNRFTYNIFLFCLDLDEIDSLASRIPFFSRNQLNLYSFYDRDHLTVTDGGTVKDNLIAYLSKNGISFPADGKIILVTLPRVLGYIFNPVSFYFCFDAAGNAFCAVAQVGNTFHEMKAYLLPKVSENGSFNLLAPKYFYVSPFSDLELEFEFKLRVPEERLEIQINDRRGAELVLLSALTGARAPLTTSRLAWLTVKYPFITLKVIFLIHWQAFLLWLRGLPYHAKSANAHLQRDVLNPHASISRNAP